MHVADIKKTLLAVMQAALYFTMSIIINNIFSSRFSLARRSQASQNYVSLGSEPNKFLCLPKYQM